MHRDHSSLDLEAASSVVIYSYLRRLGSLLRNKMMAESKLSLEGYNKGVFFPGHYKVQL